MKKHFLLFVVLSAVLALLLVSCSEAGSSDGGNSNGGKTVTYTVTFDSGEGSAVPPQSVQSGGKATRPADPVRSGYSFENWYSDAGLQTVYNFTQPVTRDMTLYAKWVAAAGTYTVTFDSGEGSAVSPQSVQSGGKATRPADPVRSGYSFENWYSDAGLQTVYNFDQPVTRDMTLYAKWIAAAGTYTVTFDSGEGSAVSPQSVQSGGKATRPADPVRSGYSFENWYSDAGLQTVYNFDQPVTRDMTLYAKWIAAAGTYTVTFDSGEGSAVPPQSVQSGGKATRPADPVRSGYSFENWYSDAGLQTVYNFDQPVTRDMTLYAKWIAAAGTYTVTFDSGEGSAVPPQSVQSGGRASRPADPVRSGYIFKNWYSDAQFRTVYSFARAVTSNITLYAQWIATYTVSFDSGEGSAVSPQSVQSGAKATRPADPVRSGYIFKDWYSDAGLQTVYNFDQPVTRDMTLYARWIEALKNLKGVIDTGVVPADLSAYNTLVRAVLEPYAAGAAIVAKYVDVTPRGTGDASSWENAAGDIRAVNNSFRTEAGTIHLVLVASGTHVPADTLRMRNHVAIIGGWNEWEQIGTSTISGEDTRRLFYNRDIDRTALLYGVTIADGNTSSDGGGGMNNYNSSPTLINVTFVNNKTSNGGGGMYNNFNSSPALNNVTFSGNTASFGGGMYNYESSPTLINVTFVNNEATSGVVGGGGMFNQVDSLPVLSNVTFVNNKAGTRGGGMINDNNGGTGLTIVNTLFWNNTGGASQATAGQQIYMQNDGSGAENTTISFSLVQHGITTATATSDDDTADGLGIGGGSASVTVTQSNNISGDPKLAADLADNGGFVQTIALLDNSAAADAGAYVQRSGTPGSFTFYYSENNANWFSDAVLSSSGPVPPAAALDLTATDARGYARNGRPDIGAYEYGGTAP